MRAQRYSLWHPLNFIDILLSPKSVHFLHVQAYRSLIRIKELTACIPYPDYECVCVSLCEIEECENVCEFRLIIIIY